MKPSQDRKGEVLSATRGYKGGARAMLRELAIKTVCDGQPVMCELHGCKTRGREVGICYVNDADISAAVIEKGLARDCTRFSGGSYAALEKPGARHLAFPGYFSPR